MGRVFEPITTKQGGLIPDGKGASTRDLPHALRLHALAPRREGLPEKGHKLLTLTEALDKYGAPALPEFESKILLGDQCDLDTASRTCGQEGVGDRRSQMPDGILKAGSNGKYYLETKAQFDREQQKVQDTQILTLQGIANIFSSTTTEEVDLKSLSLY